MTGARRSGRTFRAVLKALLAASEAPGREVILVSQQDSNANYTFRRLTDVTQVALDGAERLPARRIRLPNRSVISVLAPNDLAEHERGRPQDNTVIIRDP